MNYIIVGKNFTSPLLNKYKNLAEFRVLEEKVLTKSNIQFTEIDKVYAPDETSVPIILSKIKDKKRKSQIENIKNKYKWRMSLKKRFPNFYFREISIDDLESFKLPENKSYIIKPQKGFFGVSVKKITKNTDLKSLKKELKQEIEKNIKTFSKEVFTANDFIIEEYISGEEYTFDVFYNEHGSPIIVSFCHHPMSKIRGYFHLLYSTNSKIYDTFHKQIIDMFTSFNKSLGIKNLSIHAEFREKGGKLTPIEWNVPRYGGFGLADLPYYSYGVNPFDSFFEGKNPDWNKILKKHKNKYYGWVLGYNGIKIDLKKSKPDTKRFKKDLGKVLKFYELDYQKNPAFGIAYVQKNSKKELKKLLDMDFRNYFKPSTS